MMTFIPIAASVISFIEVPRGMRFVVGTRPCGGFLCLQVKGVVCGRGVFPYLCLKP